MVCSRVTRSSTAGRITVPAITIYFWIVKLLTTALGEAASDFLVFHVNPYVAVAAGGTGLLIALAIQFSVRRYIAWAYWLAVLMVAIFGTMAADVAHVVLGIPYSVSTLLFVIVLCALFALWYATEGTLSIHSIRAGRREIFYWAAVVTTFALGTAVGDLAAATFGFGYFAAGWLFVLLFALPAISYWLFRLNAVTAFWLAYIVTRPIGASFADWFGKSYLGGLGLGDGVVVAVLSVLIVAFVAYLTFSRRDAPDGELATAQQ